jgi:hypothetical protein
MQTDERAILRTGPDLLAPNPVDSVAALDQGPKTIADVASVRRSSGTPL